MKLAIADPPYPPYADRSARGNGAWLQSRARYWYSDEASHSGTGCCFAFGAIIGVVDLIDVHRHGEVCDSEVCKPWGESGYVEKGGRTRLDIVHLVLENPRPIAVPISLRGRLGIWNLPADVEASLR